ncbi:sensor histidine kinase [Phenylobacterium montanum]|uniref:histidine kinase n=1 Tax=Phenylobacterium montanum TaxID=2823693 RepID=A0A975IXL0_9CAUL|nr:sensor histidine kinase [Caulobacter sp. S6]QUD89521.1 sensor histidine kinase [Caulobacter sp. S6]
MPDDRAKPMVEPIAGILNRVARTAPLPLWRGQVVALASVAAATGLRWALEPVIGADVSFATLFPAVLVATLSAGVPSALTTIVAGAAATLWFSMAQSHQHPADAIPRLIVWVITGSMMAVISFALRRTLVDLKDRTMQLRIAQDELRVLVRELEHRGKNTLAVIQAISNATARASSSVNEYRSALSGKLQALGRAYSLLTRDRSTPAPLAGLIQQILAPFGDQVVVQTGPPLLVDPQVSVAFALALHELATNAAKYGALSGPQGRVELSWRSHQDRYVLTWQECGGPRPPAQTTEGFGSKLIRQAFARVPGAELSIEAAPAGLSCTVKLSPRQGGLWSPPED